MVTEPRRIAITGCGGFVGSWLRRRIDDEGRDIALPILSSRSGDLRDPASVESALRTARPDVIVHLAAIAAPMRAREEPREAWDVNVMGTLNLASAVQRWAPEARFLFVGSSEAYGGAFASHKGPLPEEASFDPRNVYGATKAAADLMIGEMAHRGLRALRLRPFNHTGPGQSPDYVVGAFARQIALIEKGNQPPVIQVGNLEAERDFLDVRDVVAAYLAAADEKVEADGSASNIATGHPVSIAEILRTLLKFADVLIEVEIDQNRYRPNDVPIASGDRERARQRLDWQPRIDLATTLRDTLDYWREQVG